MLTARREQSAALLTVPGISHWAMLRVTAEPVPDAAAWALRDAHGDAIEPLCRQANEEEQGRHMAQSGGQPSPAHR